MNAVYRVYGPDDFFRKNREPTGSIPDGQGHLQADLARLSLSRCGGRVAYLSGIFYRSSQEKPSYKIL